MKILKKAEQKNISIDKDFYTERELVKMMEDKEIAYFDKKLNIKYEGYEMLGYSEQKETDVVIFTDDLKEVKVALVDGHYHTVAIGNNNKTYYINL